MQTGGGMSQVRSTVLFLCTGVQQVVVCGVSQVRNAIFVLQHRRASGWWHVTGVLCVYGHLCFVPDLDHIIKTNNSMVSQAGKRYWLTK